MTEKKWTKGPWGFDGTGPHNVFGCEINDSLGGCIAGSWHGKGDTARANAHLIRTAPELYDALEGMLDLWVSTMRAQGFDPDHVVEHGKAIAALAKARGEK